MVLALNLTLNFFFSAESIRNGYRLSRDLDLEDIGSMADPFEIRRIPGKGFGMVATQDLEPGDLVSISNSTSLIPKSLTVFHSFDNV